MTSVASKIGTTDTQGQWIKIKIAGRKKAMWRVAGELRSNSGDSR